ncbi:hypothetical protein [Mucilaginibacter sp. HD30]
MKKTKVTIWLICMLPLVISIVVLQRLSNIPDFLRGALTGVCIGLQLMFFVLLKKKKPTPGY